MTKYKEPRVKCCAYGSAFIEPYFKTTADDWDNPRIFFDVVPSWCIRGASVHEDEYFDIGHIGRDINYCPKCGTKLPGLELHPDLDETKCPVIHSYGEGCETCGGYGRDCECIKPITMWRVDEY